VLPSETVTSVFGTPNAKPPANVSNDAGKKNKLAGVYDHVDIDPSPIRNKIREIIGQFEHKFAELELEHERSMDKVESGDDVALLSMDVACRSGWATLLDAAAARLGEPESTSVVLGALEMMARMGGAPPGMFGR
jgi:hypothetical protein